MPKRSNQFQRLIANIERMLAEEGWVVTESKMIKDLQTGNEVEADVAIEGSPGGHAITIALECRARSRKDDVEWIRSLIGKYESLPVNQVIAVSKSGFSAEAKAKAEQNNLRLLTIEDADTADWKAMFYELGFVEVEALAETVLETHVISSDNKPDFMSLDSVLYTSSLSESCYFSAGSLVIHWLHDQKVQDG